MSEPGIIQQFLADTVETALRAGGNPFDKGKGSAAPEVRIADTQRRWLVAGLAALHTTLSGVEAEQLVADELANLCHRLTHKEAPECKRT